MTDAVKAAKAMQGLAVNDAKAWPAIVAEKKPYYEKRIVLFEQYHARELAKIEAAKAAAEAIKIVLPDGKEIPGVRMVTTPMDVAKGISNSLAKKCLVAKVDGRTWDLFRPLEGDCALSLHNFDDEEGKETFWHSSAHLLGQALELTYGVDLTIGPSLEDGFYYDCFMGDNTLTDGDKPTLEKAIDSAIKENQQFQRVVVTREEALSMFQENKFKARGAMRCTHAHCLYTAGCMPDARIVHALSTSSTKPLTWHVPSLCCRLRSFLACQRMPSSRSTVSAPWWTCALGPTCPTRPTSRPSP